MSKAGFASPTDGPSPALAMRNHFLGWQCRVRQIAARDDGGRPGPGMCPKVQLEMDGEPLGRITVLIVPRDPEKSTAEFRHMCKRTLEPANRYSSAVQYLSATYYQQPRCFDDEMTALFGFESEIASALRNAGRCRFTFEQYSQRYELSCRVRGLAETEPAFQATYWHNSLFNPELPGRVSVLGFAPDWVTAIADPLPGQGR